MRRLLADILRVLVVAGVPLLFWATYTGPFQWIAEAQLRIIGANYIFVTLLVTWLAWLLVCAGVTWVFCRALGRPFVFVEYFQSRDQLVRRFFPAALAVGLLFLIGCGAYFEYTFRTTADTAAQFSINDLVAGRPCPSHFILITDARSDPDLAQTLEESSSSSSKSETHYFPLLPKDYHRGDPVYAFAEISSSRVESSRMDDQSFLPD